jgi:murein L,D-transpeptidase YafK
MPSRRLLLAALVAGAAGVGAWAHLPAGAPLPPGTAADLVVVEKGRRRLTLYRGGAALKAYRVSLGGAPEGHKRREGDERTPEGRYVLDWRKENSAFHRALHVSYPDSADVAAAAARGEPPGGAIMVHGLPNRAPFLGRLHRLADWTDGCIAVTNREMDEIWDAVPDGTPIEIRP